MARILVVDEEILICDAITAVLEEEGHQVVGVRSLDRARTKIDTFWDLVIMHGGLPEEGLGDVVAALRRRGAEILLMSSKSKQETAIDRRELSAGATILKPIDPVELRRVVAELLAATTSDVPEVPDQPRVLVVDDDEMVRMSVIDILEDQGYPVSSAESGEEAQDLLKESVFDILLTDVMMGGISGLELVESLPPGRDLVVLVMTGYASKDLAVSVLQHGAYDLLEKPLDPSRVAGAVGRAWRTRRAELENRRFLADLRRLNQELIVARDRAEAAGRAKTELLTNMSHEIRTPLNGVLGCLDLLRMIKLEEKESKLVNAAHMSGTLLLDLLTSILDYVELEGAAVRPFAELDVLDTMHRLTESNRERFADAGLLLDLKSKGIGTVRTRGDARSVTRLVQLLLDNALSFTPEGEVELSLASDEGDILIAVRDTGVGIAPEHRDAVFEPLFQVDGSSTRQVGGAGMGLALAKRLACSLDATLELESELGVGSRFSVRLPVEDATAS